MELQNVFVMTGIFVFPGIMGKSLNLPAGMVADLYSAAFIGRVLSPALSSLPRVLPAQYRIRRPGADPVPNLWATIRPRRL